MIENTGVSAPVLELLLSNNADVLLAEDIFLSTPLHALITSGSIEAVAVLLDRLRATSSTLESVLLSVDKKGRLPFHCAAHKNVEMAKLLMEQPGGQGISPSCSLTMLFARENHRGSLLDRVSYDLNDEFLYLACYTNAPLAVPAIYDKNQYTPAHAPVRINPYFNEFGFQLHIVSTFLNKGWKWLSYTSTSFQEDGSSASLGKRCTNCSRSNCNSKLWPTFL